MIHSTKLHTVGNTETPGDAFGKDFRADITALLSKILDQAGVGPVIMWGDWAMLYYGIPMGVNELHLLVPDDKLQKSHAALKSAGYKDEPFVIQESHGLLDPNIRWEELGSKPLRVVGKLNYGQARLPVIIHKYSSAGKTFDVEMAASWKKCAGLAVPPLKELGKSFLRAYFGLRRSGATSMTQGTLGVWIASVKGYGYTPLGIDAMKGVPGVDEEMKLYWERGY
ncbi:hypothetical protein BKA70DRAFT_766349 [Coprinopsis sp. MPI-PUGE-AT-0042]|nr:hypothetical protein BKA70DRAFT_766349 [Coprinopsis sp. MPI-PUGE-AT-0042]